MPYSERTENNPPADEEANERRDHERFKQVQVDDSHEHNAGRCQDAEEDDKHERRTPAFNHDAIVAELLVLLIIMVIRAFDKFAICHTLPPFQNRYNYDPGTNYRVLAWLAFNLPRSLQCYFHSSELTSSASSCDCLCNSRYMASLYSWYALHACRKLCTTTALTTIKTASPHTVQASTCSAGVMNVIKPTMLPLSLQAISSQNHVA